MSRGGLSFAIICVGILVLYIFAIFEAGSLANPSGPSEPLARSTPHSAAAKVPSIPTPAIGGVRLPEEAIRVTEDEKALRNILVAIPVLVTALIAFAPFAIRNFVDNTVREAVDKRVQVAENALSAAEEKIRSATGELEWKLRAQQSFIYVQMAYLHWNQGDPELALHYARSGSEGLKHTLELVPSNHPDCKKIQNFRSDALDGCAYYAADFKRSSGTSRTMDETTQSARDRALEMLNQLSHDRDSEPNLIERVDTCLFVVWCLRDHLQEGAVRQAFDLFKRWRTPLENHAWKPLQKQNYECYKAWYELPAV